MITQKYGAHIIAWNIRREIRRYEWTLPYEIGESLSRRRGCVLPSKEKKYIKTDDQKKIRRSIGEWKFLIKCTALMKQWKRQNLKSKQPMHGNSEYVTARTIDDEVA